MPCPDDHGTCIFHWEVSRPNTNRLHFQGCQKTKASRCSVSVNPQPQPMMTVLLPVAVVPQPVPRACQFLPDPAPTNLFPAECAVPTKYALFTETISFHKLLSFLRKGLHIFWESLTFIFFLRLPADAFSRNHAQQENKDPQVFGRAGLGKWVQKLDTYLSLLFFFILLLLKKYKDTIQVYTTYKYNIQKIQAPPPKQGAHSSRMPILAV